MRLKELSRECTDILYGAVNNLQKSYFCITVWKSELWGNPAFKLHEDLQYLHFPGGTGLEVAQSWCDSLMVWTCLGFAKFMEILPGELCMLEAWVVQALKTQLHDALCIVPYESRFLLAAGRAPGAYVSAEGSLNECASAKHIQLVSFLGEICQKLLSSCSCSLHVG